MQKIKTTIIGLGRIGHRHATIIKNSEHFDLQAIVDTDLSKKEIAQNEFEVDFYQNIEDLPENNTENAIAAICTPNGLHAKNCITALQKNYNVLCEKPFGLNAKECDAVISLSNQKNKKVFCVMQNRYSSTSKWLKSVVSENKLGEIYQIVVNCFWNRNEEYYKTSNWKGTKNLDGGILFTQFSHFIDTIFWLFGDLKVTASKTYFQKLNNLIEIEDAGFFAFETAKNTFGTFNYSINHHKNNLESSITIIGENGSIKVGGQYMDKIEFCNIENYEMPKLEPVNPPNNYGKYKGSAANHSFVYQQIAKYFNNKKAHITIGKEGLNVVKIIESTYRLASKV